MIQPLDGPSKQYKLTSVGTSTVVKVESGGAPYTERKVVTMQPDGKMYVFFGDGGSAPSAATVAADGFLHGKDSMKSYEASDKQELYILALTGTIDVRVAERA